VAAKELRELVHLLDGQTLDARIGGMRCQAHLRPSQIGAQRLGVNAKKTCALGEREQGHVSFIRIKALFLKKCATLPSAFSGWVFSDNLARQHFLVLSHL
jgi:hypothetical protein